MIIKAVKDIKKKTKTENDINADNCDNLKDHTSSKVSSLINESLYLKRICFQKDLNPLFFLFFFKAISHTFIFTNPVILQAMIRTLFSSHDQHPKSNPRQQAKEVLSLHGLSEARHSLLFHQHQ